MGREKKEGRKEGKRERIKRKKDGGGWRNRIEGEGRMESVKKEGKKKEQKGRRGSKNGVNREG